MSRQGHCISYLGGLHQARQPWLERYRPLSQLLYSAKTCGCQSLAKELKAFEDYLKWSRRLRSVMEPLIIETLKAGASVVMDFAGNTAGERSWVRSLFEAAGADHVLYVLEASEEMRLSWLIGRNEERPRGFVFRHHNRGRV